MTSILKVLMKGEREGAGDIYTPELEASRGRGNDTHSISNRASRHEFILSCRVVVEEGSGEWRALFLLIVNRCLHGSNAPSRGVGPCGRKVLNGFIAVCCGLEGLLDTLSHINLTHSSSLTWHCADGVVWSKAAQDEGCLRVLWSHVTVTACDVYPHVIYLHSGHMKMKVSKHCYIIDNVFPVQTLHFFRLWTCR